MGRHARVPPLEDVDAGRQAYVVCPRIGDEEGAGGTDEDGPDDADAGTSSTPATVPHAGDRDAADRDAADPDAWQAQWILAEGDGLPHWTKLNGWLRLTAVGSQMWITGR